MKLTPSVPGPVVGVAFLRVSAVTSVSVAVIASLGRRRVTVVVAVLRGIVRVLLVLRVGRVVLGVDGLLPDLVGRSWSGFGTSSASDYATSKDHGVRIGNFVDRNLVSLRHSGGINLRDEHSSAD